MSAVTSRDAYEATVKHNKALRILPAVRGHRIRAQSQQGCVKAGSRTFEDVWKTCQSERYSAKSLNL